MEIQMKDENIFTIGDECEQGVIKSFKITNDKCRVNFTGGHSLDLKYLKHKKQPLFTTSDNVEIFVGDEYWFVNRWGVYNKTASEGTYLDLENYYFSTKEKAEEYVLMNKPCLSIKDLQNLQQSCGGFKVSRIFFEHIKDLVKQKLKQ